VTDGQLLERLNLALTPVGVPSEPAPAAIQHLHRAIDATRHVGATPSRRRPGRLLTIGVAAAVAATCVAVLVVAASLPHIHRETATEITVAVTSPAFGDVAERQRELETALADGDLAAIAEQSAKLRLAIRSLAPGEWAPIRTEIEDLLSRADALLGRRRSDNQLSPTGLATEPSAPDVAGVPVTTRPTGQTPTSTTPTDGVAAVAPNDADEIDDDNSGPGGGSGTETDVADDNSGPGGGGGDELDDDSSGPGG
jgi:hypothetical protein